MFVEVFLKDKENTKDVSIKFRLREEQEEEAKKKKKQRQQQQNDKIHEKTEHGERMCKTERERERVRCRDPPMFAKNKECFRREYDLFPAFKTRQKTEGCCCMLFGCL